MASDYQAELFGLLPKGPAWAVGDGGIIDGFLAGWSQELARVNGRADALVGEADPRSTFELLADYERIFGLPSDCLAGVEQSLGQRQNTLTAKMTAIGGQSKAYFITLAAAAGYAVTITEYSPFTVASTVDSPIYGINWVFAWQVSSAQFSQQSFFLANSPVSDALSSWGNALLECLINQFKPAHTIPIFTYAGADRIGYGFRVGTSMIGRT